ncbi:SMI1/KNR4 family protein [Mammaliicoccus sp. Dog046]|uniref:SMI1/KNR4 family protein n=1 Tax=Mammaliicoccus sp. Dog046 TaxID=3034233 RepID=UPI002B25CF6A|nr:SMI1/KNR4 family protein [Mammaliicoccus sp. Dog046]WQK85419.1 SMI1/KNR4 family protein [Mammaliicoccus sp. Dog046]
MGRKQTLDFNNKEFWSEEEKLNDEQLIHEFEKKIGHRFPESFIQFTKEFHNGSTKKAEFYVNEDMSPEIRFMLSFNKETEYFNIWKGSYYGLIDFDPYVVIAEDIAGNLIALDYSKSETEPSVVFVDHELLGLIFLEEDREYSDEEIEAMEASERLKDFPWAIFPVADSFLDFLNGLDGENPPEEGEWFVDSDENINEINKSIIDNVEREYSIQFPQTYKNLIIQYNGKRIEHNPISNNEEFQFLRFYSLDKKYRFNIPKLFDKKVDGYWEDIIPFGIGLGGTYAFDYSKNQVEPAIISMPYKQAAFCENSIMEKYDTYIKHADSFEEFCHKMKYPPTLD